MAGELDAFMAGAGLSKAEGDAKDTTTTAAPETSSAESEQTAQGVEQTVEPETDAAAAGLNPTEPETPEQVENKGSGKPGRDDDENDDETHLSRRQMKRLRYQNAQQRKRIEELERERAARSPDPANPAAQAAAVDRSAFKSDAEWVEALVRTRMAEQAAEKARVEREELERTESQRAFVAAWTDKVKACFPTPEARQEYQDAMEDAFDGKPGEAFSDDVAGYLFQHPKGPAVLRYLADHPTTCERLRNSHPFDQADILRKIVAYVERPVQTEPANAGATGRKPVAPVGSIRTGAAATNPSARSAEELFMAAVK